MCGQHQFFRLLWSAFLHDFPRLFEVVLCEGEGIVEKDSVEEILIQNKAAVGLSFG